MDDFMEDVLSNSSKYPNELASPAGVDWLAIDWTKLADSQSPSEPSEVQTIVVEDRLLYVKRDDQLRLAGSHISGNKARKMLALNRLPPEEFPDCIVSHGGPQSNAMVALAAVIRYKNDQLSQGQEKKRFVYYTKTLPRFLRNYPSGNLFRATTLGMELVELPAADYNQLFGGEWGGKVEAPAALTPPVPGGSLWVPQGAASTMAVAGARQLACEIRDFWTKRGDAPLVVFVPGGTCSTALLLRHSLRELALLDDTDNRPRIEVAVIPCVGDEAYSRRQMMSLNAALRVKDVSDTPHILPPAPVTARPTEATYFPFGEPDALILDTFRKMDAEHELPIDLLYNAPALTILLRHWKASFASNPTFVNKAAMYVHSGGLEGVNTQLLRYKYKGLVDSDEIQLPGSYWP